MATQSESDGFLIKLGAFCGVLAFVWAVVIVVFPELPATARTMWRASSKVAFKDLQPTDCANDAGEQDKSYSRLSWPYRVVDCRQWHDLEVFYVTDLLASINDSYDEDKVREQFLTACDDARVKYLGGKGHELPPEVAEGRSFVPGKRAYATGDRHVVCVFTGLNNSRLHGSVKGRGIPE